MYSLKDFLVISIALKQKAIRSAKNIMHLIITVPAIACSKKIHLFSILFRHQFLIKKIKYIVLTFLIKNIIPIG